MCKMTHVTKIQTICWYLGMILPTYEIIISHYKGLKLTKKDHPSSMTFTSEYSLVRPSKLICGRLWVTGAVQCHSDSGDC